MPIPGIITVPVAPWTGGYDNGGSDYDKGSTDPITGNVNDDLRDGFIQDIVTNPGSGEQVKIEHDSDMDTILENTLNNFSESGKDSSAVNSLLSMYKLTGDESWLEKYLDDLIARENAQSARDYEKMMSDTAVSRMVSDIKNAGLNPWLALQGISSASSGSAVQAGTSGVNSSSLSTSAKNNENNIIASIIGDVIKVIGIIAGLSMKSGKNTTIINKH